MIKSSTSIKQKLLFVCLTITLVPLTLFGSLAIKTSFSDGPSVLFSGGPLISGEMMTGQDLNSNYMGGIRQRLWKRWPEQAERDGRAIMRIDGKRYQRNLIRIKSGPIVNDVTQAFSEKYPVTMTPAEVEAEELWLFELAPNNQEINGDIR